MVKMMHNKDELKAEVAAGLAVVDFFTTWCGPCKVVVLLLLSLHPSHSIHPMGM